MQLAEESQKTKRAREKLEDQFASQKEHITGGALREKVDEIQRWIARHAGHRVVLKKKSIALFDANQNPAEMSPKVATFALSLEKEFS